MNDQPDCLASGLAALNITATPTQQAQLHQFLFLLQKWNRVYNLTAISEPEQAIPLHLLDSLAVLPYLSGGRILDVGTGAGLPGIPLAIIETGLQFVLLDSNSKKTRFVQQAVLELGLKNIDVVTSRIENYQPQQGFDSILARAWADLGTIWRDTRGFLLCEGQVLALKGQCPTQEMEQLERCQSRIHRLEIPGLKAERHLIQITND